jgi:hypothetical protein
MRLNYILGNIILLLIIVSSHPANALSKSDSEYAEAGSTYTITISVDSLAANKKSFSVYVKLTANAFGENVSGFFKIVLYAKITSVNYDTTSVQKESDIGPINNTGEMQEREFIFSIVGKTDGYFVASGRADFREDLPGSTNPETIVPWFDAFSNVTVEAKHSDLFVIGLSFLILIAISRTLRRKRKEK